MKLKDLIGQRFGKLVVISRAGHQNKKATWLCQCDCGREKIVISCNLVQKKSQSCGCVGKTPKYTYGKCFNRVYRTYKDNAKARGYSFELTHEEFYALLKGNCHYTDKPPSNKKTWRGESFVYSGIDRLDNSKGYSVENCVSCCIEVNIAKSSMLYEDFIKLARTVVSHIDTLCIKG